MPEAKVALALQTKQLQLYLALPQQCALGFYCSTAIALSKLRRGALQVSSDWANLAQLDPERLSEKEECC